MGFSRNVVRGCTVGKEKTPRTKCHRARQAVEQEPPSRRAFCNGALARVRISIRIAQHTYNEDENQKSFARTVLLS